MAAETAVAGPDGSRYDHGRLGDAIEATRVLWLERHGLDVLRELSLPTPHVFEDIAPRPVVLAGAPPGRGLLTVRSGPDGGQLAMVTADPALPRGLRLVALGDTVGGHHRWLAPTTDGRQLRRFNPAADWSESRAVALPGRAILTAAVPEAPALAVLLDGGKVVTGRPSARAGSRR